MFRLKESVRLLAIAIPPRPPSFERDADPGADASDAVWLGASDDVGLGGPSARGSEARSMPSAPAVPWAAGTRARKPPFVANDRLAWLELGTGPRCVPSIAQYHLG